jgi:acetyl-CoA acetyltransferase
MSIPRVAIVAGARTPFVKSGKEFASMGPLALAKHAVQGLLERHRINPENVDALAFGAVVPERGKPNLAREIVLETGLPARIEAQTVSSYCITGLRSATIIADAISEDRIEAGIAGGVEWPATGTPCQHSSVSHKRLCPWGASARIPARVPIRRWNSSLRSSPRSIPKGR